MMMGEEADGENGEPACCEFNADPIWVWDVFETWQVDFDLIRVEIIRY